MRRGNWDRASILLIMPNTALDRNTRPPDMPPKKSVCRSGSNSYYWTWNNRLVPNQERSKSRLYILTLLIYLICRVHHEKLGWMKHKMESRLPGKISITSDMQMIPLLRQKARTKEPLDKSERGEWKSWLKTQHSANKDHGIWPHHFMANRWGNSANSDRLYFGGSKITADGDCSHEIKRQWLLGRKAMTNLDSILKSRDIT